MIWTDLPPLRSNKALLISCYPLPKTRLKRNSRKSSKLRKTWKNFLSSEFCPLSSMINLVTLKLSTLDIVPRLSEMTSFKPRMILLTTKHWLHFKRTTRFLSTERLSSLCARILRALISSKEKRVLLLLDMLILFRVLKLNPENNFWFQFIFSSKMSAISEVVMSIGLFQFMLWPNKWTFQLRLLRRLKRVIWEVLEVAEDLLSGLELLEVRVNPKINGNPYKARIKRCNKEKERKKRTKINYRIMV